MNLHHILSEIAKADPELPERISPRRAVIKNLGRTVALSALPFALGSLLNKAYGKTTSAITDILNFALKLEYLESEFYIAGLNAAAAMSIPATDIAGLTIIRDHEVQHVAYLRSAIIQAGGAPVTLAANSFDFTANGTFSNVFSSYDTFLAVAQTFEDTGVRAYKGQAGNLASDNATLTAALQIHSVEARHASHIRQMRRLRGGPAADIKPWITTNQNFIGSAVNASYAGEELTTQATINIININGQSIDQDAASEAFDEPLDQATVEGIVAPFFV